MPGRSGGRVALRGAGVMARAFAGACRALGWRVVSVSSRDAARSTTFADDLGAGAVAVGFDEQLAGPPPDVAVVATPPFDHAAAALTWAERGVPVVIATPVAATLAEADRLVAAEQGGARFLFGSSMPSAPVAQELFRRVSDVGEIGHLSARSIRPAPDWGGFLDPSWGGGVMSHPAVHPLSLVLLIGRVAGLGAPVEVSAELRGVGGSVPGSAQVDTEASVELRFASGPVASVAVDWRDDRHRAWDLQVAGAGGVVRLDMDPAPTLEVDGAPVPLRRVAPADEQPLEDVGLTPMFRTLWADITEDRPTVMNAAFGRDVLEIVSAANWSSGAGGPTPLPFTGPRDRTPIALRTLAAGPPG